MKRTKKMKMMKTNLQKKKMVLKLTTLRMIILKLQRIKRIRRMAKTIVMKRKIMTKRKKWMLRKARLTKPLTR